MPRHRTKHDKSGTTDTVKREGGLVVSFINTAVGDRHPWLNYADLLAWTRRQQVMEDAQIDHLEGLAAEHPEQADAFDDTMPRAEYAAPDRRPAQAFGWIW